MSGRGYVRLLLCVFVCASFVPISDALVYNAHEGRKSGERVIPHVGATFGPQNYKVEANIKFASPKDLCSARTPTFDDTVKDCKVNATARSAWRNKIVLAERGNCPFVVKVCNAQKLGAVGVIIGHNSSAQADINIMGGWVEDNVITIPSVLIRQQRHYFQLTNAVVAAAQRAHENVWARLDNEGREDPASPPATGPLPPSSSSYSSTRSSVDWVTLAIFLFFVLACALHIVWRIRRRCNRANSPSAPQPLLQPQHGNANSQPLVVSAPLSVVVNDDSQSRISIPLLPADSLAGRS